MRNHNSQRINVKYVDMLVAAYHDLASAIIPQNEITRDVALLRLRVANEGMNFLTKVLPALGKSIDVSLASGCTLDAVYSGFQKRPGTELPKFCYAAFDVLFRADGVPRFATWHSDYLHWLVNEPEDVEAVETAIRENEIDLNSPLLHRIHSCIRRWEAVDHGKAALIHSKGQYPGSHLLNEMGFSREAVDLISQGKLRELEPLVSDGQLSQRRETAAVALRLLRQVCFMFYKLELPYTDEQKANVLADFVQVDSHLDYQAAKLGRHDKSVLCEARRIIRRILCNADPRSGLPRHGPGAVATGEKLPEKHEFKRFYTRLNAAFPYDQWFFVNSSHVCDSYKELQASPELEAGTAKVVLVPKDSRGPRLISCEPLEYQWIQQALMRVLVDTIEEHSLTAGHVNFTRQEPNRELALEGSLSYDWVTLDMKEASDRVSLELVKDLFPEEWYECLYASRSASTMMPCGTIVNLKKFAPMGSATCFPVEALIFWALSVSAIMITHDLPLRKAATKVYVYGDDIVVDANYHGVVNSTLPAFSLMLNKGKCCTAGPFKESCGMDAFYGIPVTPVKIRALWCQTLKPSDLASYVEYSNEFYRRGMFETAFMLEELIQTAARQSRLFSIPTVSGEGPGVIAFVRQYENPISKNRAVGCKIRAVKRNANGPDYQRLEVRGYRLDTRTIMASVHGWLFLLRKLVELEAKHSGVSQETTSACSLLTGQYPVAHRTRLKSAWTPLI